MQITDLSTPALIVDEHRLAGNLRRMQEKADSEEVALRPHVKTHKSIELARRQVEGGARGITVATVQEAETFVEAGFSDVRLAYSLAGRSKHARLVELMDRARISFCVDTEAGIRQAAAFYADRSRTVDVLIEVDTGHRRCGVRWNGRQLDGLAALIEESPALRLQGLLTHAGQVYYGPEDEETRAEALRRVAADERDRILSAAEQLREAGRIPDDETFEISIGSTPTMAGFENTAGSGLAITEIRPGNYVFNDAMQLNLGSAALASCALTVLTTVTSRHREGTKDRIVVDAGKKVLTTDTGYGTDGYGLVLYNAQSMRAHPHAHIPRLSEEHGWVYVPGGSTYHVGDRMQIVPNHACVTTATQQTLFVVDGDDVTATWNVEA